MNENRLLEQTRKAACVPKVFSTPWSPSVFSLLFCRLSSVLPTSSTTLLCSLLLHLFLLKCCLSLLALSNRNIFILFSSPLCLSPLHPSPSQRGTKTPSARILFISYFSAQHWLAPKWTALFPWKLPCFRKYSDATKPRLFKLPQTSLIFKSPLFALLCHTGKSSWSREYIMVS